MTNLDEELIRYAKEYIKTNCNETFYKKKEILDEIKEVGIDDWQELSFKEDSLKFVDFVKQDIEESIRMWCSWYKKDISKDFLLNLTTYDVYRSCIHSFFNEAPDDMPILDYKNLAFMRIPLKDIINYTKDDFEKLPIYNSKLKEINKQKKINELLEWKNNLKNYFDYYDY